MHGKSPAISQWRFRDANRVHSSNFNAMTLKFSDEFDHPISHVFIFGNMFPESRSFAAMPVSSCIKASCYNLSLSN